MSSRDGAPERIDGRQDGLAKYENVDGSYLAERQLKKSAGWKLLWALGVGAVISGDFVHSRHRLVAQAPEELAALGGDAPTRHAP